MNKIITIILALTSISAFAETTGQGNAENPSVATTSVKPQTTAHAISVNDASTLVEKQQAVIIDVREHAEAAKSKIPGAINIPLSQLKNRLAELEKFKHSPVITQCRSGRRSQEAQKLMSASGFDNVQNMDGGLVAWEKAGLKTEKKCC